MNSYLLFKSLHLIAVISWMAGLLYLPRIFVYHVENIDHKISSSIFETMEKKLFYFIMMPAMILSWLFGILLIHSIGIESFSLLWFQLKLGMVLLLTSYHFFLFQCLKSLSLNNSKYSPKFYRIINEVPTILLILVVFIVIFKPI